MSIGIPRALVILISVVAILLYLSEKKIPLESAFKEENNFVAKTYLYDFSSYRYNNSGELQEVVNAESALDIPKSKEVQLVKPRIHTHDGNKNIWVASAERGVMRKDNSLVILRENVLVMNKNTQSKVETSEVKFDLKKRIAQTKEQVTVSHVAGHTIAKGMIADLKKSKLELQNQVKTIYFNVNDIINF